MPKTMKAASDAEFGRRSRIVSAVVVAILLYIGWQAWLVAAAAYPAQYEYDEGVYAETAAAWSAGHRLYTAVFLPQPPLLIGVLAHAFGAFGRSLGAARGVVIALSTVWLVGLALIAARAAGVRAALWTVAIAGSAPTFVTASHTVEMEGPAEALAAVAVALAIAAAATSRGLGGGMTWRTGVLWASAGCAAGLAAMTKFTAFTSLVPLAVALAIGPAPQTASRKPFYAALMLGGAALAAGAVGIWTGGLSTEMWRETVAFHAAVAAVTPIDFARPASLMGGFAAANWFATALGLAGAASALVPRPGNPSAADRTDRHHMTAVAHRAVAAWLAADVAALLVWRPVWPHHLAMLMTPLVALAAMTIEQVSRHRPRAVAAIAAFWLLTLTTTIVSARPAVSDALRTAAIQTHLAVPPEGQVVTDDPLVAFLAGRDVPPDLSDTSEARMRSGWLTVSALDAALADPRVRGVVLWRGTFRRMTPRFVDEALRRFPRRVSLTDGREILSR
jgi:Dolichyl-phosphate-mannose-protein mannosyltransferase